MADHDYDQNETQQPPADPLADAVEKIQFASPEEGAVTLRQAIGRTVAEQQATACVHPTGGGALVSCSATRAGQLAPRHSITSSARASNEGGRGE
jgi:hypothetical protein